MLLTFVACEGFEAVASTAHTEIGPGICKMFIWFHDPWNHIILVMPDRMFLAFIICGCCVCIIGLSCSPCLIFLVGV
jgi:hypothetical protein